MNSTKIKEKMVKDFRSSIFLLLLSSILYGQNTLEFANYLFYKGEYYRAITEYYRTMFSQRSTQKDSNFCILQIAKCYYLGENYDEAIHWINSHKMQLATKNQISIKLNYYLGLSYFKSGFYRSSLIEFSQIKNNDEKAQVMIGIIYLYLSKWQQSKNIFENLSNTASFEIQQDAKELSQVASSGKKLSTKNPLLAGFLSGIIPGSGYAYTKHYQTALSSFLLNSILIGTYFEFQKKNFQFAGGITLLVAFGWYLGNILGSFKSAIQYNEKNHKEFLEKKLKRFNHYLR